MADRLLPEEPFTMPTTDRAVAREVSLNEIGNASPSVVLYVVGGAGRDRNSALRDFPMIDREDGESEAAHLVRVAQLVDEAMAAGGTHLLVPREQAGWLGDHPLLIDYFGEYHELAEASAKTGVVFTLHPRGPQGFQDKVHSSQIGSNDEIALATGDGLVQPQTDAEQPRHSSPPEVDLSSVALDPRVNQIRRPTSPVFARGMTFEGHFDYFTLFYDIFEEQDRKSILAVGPPLPSQMEPITDIEFISASSGESCEFTYIRPRTRWSTAFFRITPRSETLALAILFGGQQVIRAVQPNLSRLFSGRRVLIAKNKDNPLEWIVDWARYHVTHFGIDAVLLYDNCSHTYTAADLRRALTLVPGIAVIVVIDWPYPYATPREVCWPPSFERWSDSGFLEIGRRRFLSEATFALHLDVDEMLVQRSRMSLDDLIETHEVAWFQFSSQDMMAYPHPRNILLRHRDVYWIKPADAVRPKYLVVPRRCPEDARWWIHLIHDAPFVEIDPSKLSIAHFNPLTTGWGGRGDRLPPTAWDPEKHIEDTMLRDRMNEAFSDWNPIVRPWDPLESSDPELMRVAALEAHDRGETDRALEFLARAMALDPYHPRQQVLRRELLTAPPRLCDWEDTRDDHATGS